MNIEKKFNKLGYNKVDENNLHILYKSTLEKNTYIFIQAEHCAKYVYESPFDCKYSFITDEELKLMGKQMKLIKEKLNEKIN